MAFEYQYFNDARAYQVQGLLHPEGELVRRRPNILNDYKPKRVSDPDFGELWFDGRTGQLCTPRADFYIQLISIAGFMGGNRYIYAAASGRKVQFGQAKEGEIFAERLSDRTNVWVFDQIGKPLQIHTAFDDKRRDNQRPREERYQLLSTASKFKCYSDLRKSMSLLEKGFRNFGNMSGSDAAFGRQSAIVNRVEFSSQLMTKVEARVFNDL